MGYLDDLRIDRYNLEEELVRQPQLYMEWALKAARASVEKEDAKRDVDIARAEVDKKVRANPEEYGIPEGKVTDKAIKLTVERHPKVKRYFKRYLRKSKQDKILSDAKKAFEQRKRMLGDLVSLNIQLHFAEPRTPTAYKDKVYDSDRRNLLRGMKKTKIRRRRKT